MLTASQFETFPARLRNVPPAMETSFAAVHKVSSVCYSLVIAFSPQKDSMSLTVPLSKIPPLPDQLFLIENLVFKDQIIALDGYRFKNCAFVDCRLKTVTGRFKIEECYLQGTFWLIFDGNAQRAARLASLIDWSVANQEARVFYHQNGGISIP